MFLTLSHLNYSIDHLQTKQRYKWKFAFTLSRVQKKTWTTFIHHHLRASKMRTAASKMWYFFAKIVFNLKRLKLTFDVTKCYYQRTSVPNELITNGSNNFKIWIELNWIAVHIKWEYSEAINLTIIIFKAIFLLCTLNNSITFSSIKQIIICIGYQRLC